VGSAAKTTRLNHGKCPLGGCERGCRVVRHCLLHIEDLVIVAAYIALAGLGLAFLVGGMVSSRG
jgi:hypothetical protein